MVLEPESPMLVPSRRLGTSFFIECYKIKRCEGMGRLSQQTLPTLTETYLKQQFDARTLQRGRQYYEQGAIANPTRKNNTLSATCHGTEPYQVSITFKRGTSSIETRCTCAVRGYCKHLVALLLTYIHEPETVKDLLSVSDLLASHDRDALLDLIQQLLQQDPELLSIVELSAAQQSHATASTTKKGKASNVALLDLSSYERQIEQTMKMDNLGRIVGNLERLKEHGQALVNQKDLVNAARLYALLLSSMSNGYDYVMQEVDYNGDVSCFSQDFAKKLGYVMEQGNLALDLRWTCLQAFLAGAERDIQIGGVDFAYPAGESLVSEATDDEWLEIETYIRAKIPRASEWQRESWVRLLAERQERDGSNKQANELIHELGTPEQRAFLLVDEQRFDEAVAIASQHFTTLPGLVKQFANRLMEAGASDQALAYMTEQHMSESRYQYDDWLVQYHQTHGSAEQAFEIQSQSFIAKPSISSYDKLKELAQAVGHWDAVYQDIHTQLVDGSKWLMLLDIALHEHDAPGTLLWFKRIEPWQRVRYREAVADVIATHEPEAAIALYQQLADELIERRNRSAYRQAIPYLRRAKAVYLAMEQAEEWRNTLQALLQKYPTLRAFKDEVKKANL